MGAYTYLAKLKDLQRLLDEHPEKIEYFTKYGAFIGDTDAVDYITKKIEEFHKKK